jgi:hypothetical protein
MDLKEIICLSSATNVFLIKNTLNFQLQKYVNMSHSRYNKFIKMSVKCLIKSFLFRHNGKKFLYSMHNSCATENWAS